MRRHLALIVTSALVLAGCGSGGGGEDLDSVEIGSGKTPSVAVEAGFTTDKTDVRVIAEGSGEEIEDGDTVKLNYVAVNGRTGKEFDNSFKAEQPMVLTLDEGSVLPGFLKGLTGQKVGARVLAAIAPQDGFGANGQTQLGVESDDTMLFLFDVVAKVPTTVSGTAEKLPSDVPQLTLKDDVPTGFEAGKDVPDEPAEATAHVVVKGEGEKIADDASVTANYLGEVYPDGEVFDESWSRGAPSVFSLDSVIACWKDLIPGQTVGSRVVLECPADDAYGDEPPEGSTIKAGDSLVFVVDLLDAA